MNLYNKHIIPWFINIWMQRKSFDSLRPRVVEAAYGTVLEIGFGSGHNLQHYKNVSKLYALEPSPELYALAKDRIAQVSFPIDHLPNSAEEIPLPDRSVDSVVSTWTLCTIPHPELALREVARVLKPDGKFYFIEHGLSPGKISSFFQKVFTPFSKHFTGGCHMERDIENLVRNAGLKVLKLEKFPMKRKPLLYMYRGVAEKC